MNILLQFCIIFTIFGGPKGNPSQIQVILSKVRYKDQRMLNWSKHKLFCWWGKNGGGCQNLYSAVW